MAKKTAVLLLSITWDDEKVTQPHHLIGGFKDANTIESDGWNASVTDPVVYEDKPRKTK